MFQTIELCTSSLFMINVTYTQCKCKTVNTSDFMQNNASLGSYRYVLILQGVQLLRCLPAVITFLCVNKQSYLLCDIEMITAFLGYSGLKVLKYQVFSL